MAGRVNVVLDRAVYYDNDTIVGMLFVGVLVWQPRIILNSCFQLLSLDAGEFILLPFEDTEIVNIAVELQCVCSFTHHKAGGEAKVVTIIYEKSTSMWRACFASSSLYSPGQHELTPRCITFSASKQVLRQRE